jgi:hypothetical protein
MVEQRSRERVDAFWSSTLETSVVELHTAGVQVRANPTARRSWRGIYVLTLPDLATGLPDPAFEGALVYAPADQVDSVSTAIAGRVPVELIEAKTWQAALADTAQAIFGPIRHYYLDHADGLAELAAGRRLNPYDSDSLGVLRAALPAREWLVTGFTAPPAVLFGIFEGETLVAAANLTAGPEAASDIGVVIHPEARGRGYGLRIAALAAKQAIAMHGIARFRALTSSQSTLAIAQRLGFVEYGRNLVAYLNDQPVPID